MYTCRTCLRRTFGTLPRHNPSLRHVLRPIRTASTIKLRQQSRTYAAEAAHTEPIDTDEPPPVIKPEKGQDGKATSPSRSVEWVARKELQYLNDPLHIGRRVQAVLAKDEFEQAAQMTRLASKDMDVAVSWNHLIDYQLKKDRIHAAFKLYNEMKKRGQKPNAQTYTIIFRGCAASKHSTLAVSETVALYHNMIKLGRIPPNTIHLNAALSVCANANDIDSMFGLLDANDNAARNPDSYTYTTILNAMRRNAAPKVARTGPVDVGGVELDLGPAKANAVKRAKLLWEEVVRRWKSGSLVIDEHLVCAMGRILLFDGYRGADAVRELFEQTMKIPIGGRYRKAPRIAGEALETAGDGKSTPPTIQSETSTYATPGRNSLSLIIESLTVTGKISEVAEYWKAFTRHHEVVPDANNWSLLLAAFRKGKSSGKAAQYLKRMPSDMVLPKHVRLAMDTCLRDNLNHLAIQNAGEVFKGMMEKLSVPDVRTLRDYLRVAWATRKRYEGAEAEGKPDAYFAWARTMTRALEQLWNVHKSLIEKAEADIKNTKDKEALGEARNFRAEVVALLRKMVGAYDYLYSEKLGIPEDVRNRIAKARNDINRYVVVYFEKEASLHSRDREERDGAEAQDSGLHKSKANTFKARDRTARGFKASTPKARDETTRKPKTYIPKARDETAREPKIFIRKVGGGTVRGSKAYIPKARDGRVHDTEARHTTPPRARASRTKAGRFDTKHSKKEPDSFDSKFKARIV
ncbi:hypothetical protein GGS20DRAFT_540007 [Poronia punctata]|nr:hypothetical protein GGS20DRAFT_540007 [Poronia punctata]